MKDDKLIAEAVIAIQLFARGKIDALPVEDQEEASKLAVASLQDDLDNRYPLPTSED